MKVFFKKLLLYFIMAVFLADIFLYVSFSASEAREEVFFMTDRGQNVNRTASDGEKQTYNKSDTWALTDALGRSAPEPGRENSVREGKYALIFYHLWHNDFMRSTVLGDKKAPRNVSAIFEQDPDAASKASLWGPEISYHYWGEPLFGFYNLDNDEYVIRKHAQMLTDAGIDAIVIDYSNYCVGGVHNESSYNRAALTKLLNTYLTIRTEGGATPQVALLLTWDGNSNGPALMRFYKDYYSKNEYNELWFRWEGKPLVLAQDVAVSEDIKDYWTYRRPWPLYTPVDGPNAWSWLSNYPQEPCYTADDPKEMVAVSVAQNWSTSLDFMSATDSDGNYIAHGRSYVSGGDNKLLKNPVSSMYGSEYGANLQQQFDRAIEIDPSVLFITGWNEWIAARFLKIPDWARCSEDPVLPGGGFCDCFTTEFSRDIEPTRQGNLGDNFYNQLCINIRRFKGTGALAPAKEYPGLAFNFDSPDTGIWDEVGYIYEDSVNDALLRNTKGIGGSELVNTTGRNDFKLLKVFHNEENIYFYAETTRDITGKGTDGWMSLYIKTGDGESWEGYNYVVNRLAVTDGPLKLEKNLGGWNWATASDNIPWFCSGNKFVVAVPRALIGIDQSSFSIEFKWADNTLVEYGEDGSAPGDILKFYENGDVAPNGRFNYLYLSDAASGEKTDGSSLYRRIEPALTIGTGIAATVAVGACTGVAISTANKKRKNKQKK